MADECGGDGCELPARRRGVLGGRWAVRAVVLTALALAGALHTQAASANGRGFSWTPSKTEPYATCGHPTPGHAACLAVVVPPYSAGSLTESLKEADPASASPAYTGTGIGGGYDPADLRSAYNLPTGSQGTGQTVAIVDAYNDPDAESDLAAYRSQYGLPACTTANGCFKKVNQTGGTTSYPASNAEWSVEMSLDVDMVSAACPNCHILLVEASSNSSANLYAAEDEAATLGATEISNSWVGGEESGETSNDKYFDHPGVPITAGSGDSGYQVNYPASSQYVIAVGGTKLSQASNSRGWSETVWSEKPTQGTGSGCSAYEPKPSWQTDKGCTHKTNNDTPPMPRWKRPCRSRIHTNSRPSSPNDRPNRAGRWWAERAPRHRSSQGRWRWQAPTRDRLSAATPSTWRRQPGAGSMMSCPGATEHAHPPPNTNTSAPPGSAMTARPAPAPPGAPRRPRPPR